MRISRLGYVIRKFHSRCRMFCFVVPNVTAGSAFVDVMKFNGTEVGVNCLVRHKLNDPFSRISVIDAGE